MKLTEATRRHLVSATVAAVYAFILHILYFAAFPIIYLLQGGAFGSMVIVQLAIILLGIIAFLILRRFPAERLTFYMVLLVVHIALTALFWALAEPVISPMITALQDKVGIVLTGQPEENFDGIYLLVSEVLMQVFLGLFYVFAMLVSLVCEGIRQARGTVPRKNETEKGDSDA